MIDTVTYVLLYVFVGAVAVFAIVASICLALIGIHIAKEILEDWGWF